MNHKPSIGVIGHIGMVGSTVFRYFKNKNFKIYGYDLRDTNNINQTLKSDIIFICIPTPFNWKTNKCDHSNIKKVLSQIPENKTVVIKSTIQIGTTEKFQKQF